MESRSDSERVWPDDRPDLLPLLPLVLSAWMDGALSAPELAVLEDHLEREGGLTPDERAALRAWIDPAAPPSAAELQALGARVRRAGVGEDARATASLTDLGLALWRSAGERDGRWADEGAVDALRALERSLGILGAEAARRMAGTPAPPLPAPAGPAPVVDPEALASFLDRDRRALRDEVRALLAHERLDIPDGLPSAAYRERVLDAVRLLAERGYGRLGFPEAYGGSNDPGAAVAVFETLAFGHLSVLVKFGVQFGLFGGSVLQLGTRRHHERWLARIGTLELPGCYAMTETLHGSNVRDLETTATYDPASDELVVHTPSEGAGKDYIGNAAVHGRMATVFARLLVGGRDHGVHAVVVPLRGGDGAPLPGVRIEDRGLKLGLNGVDNGRIWFDRVRVPRDHLLDRFGTIGDDGRYRSPISSSGRRFFGMLRTLVAGRVSVAAASVSAAKAGLAIAVPYADGRRQFGAKNAPEQPILDYPVVQRALLPRLATTYGLHFAARALQRRYADAGPDDQAELEVAAAGLKAYASDHLDTLQACREACGGAGYMAVNRFAALRADTDVFTTFEGANAVLYQLVAKGLLSRFRDQMQDMSPWRALQYLGERAETRLTELNPVVTRRTDRDHLLDPDFHAAALAYREARLLRSAAGRVRARLQDGIDSFVAMTAVQDHLVTLARAHVERAVLGHFHDAVASAPTPALSETLRSLAALYALSRIEADRGWFLEVGYVEGGKSRAIRALVGALCAETRELAVPLVAAFRVPEHLAPDPSLRRG